LAWGLYFLIFKRKELRIEILYLPPYGGINKGVYCMKNWKQSVFFGMVAIIVLSFGFVGCDNGNGTTPNPTYESVVINLPTVKTDTVKTIIGVHDYIHESIIEESSVDITYYGSGAQFTATVNGDNNPIQTVTWEIVGEADAETKITNGLLTVAVNDHGKTLTVKATSTADIDKFDTKTINVVQCLPSDFYGKWEQAQNMQNTVNTITNNEFESKWVREQGTEHYKCSLYWVPIVNDGSNSNFTIIDYPCGFAMTGVIYEVIEPGPNNCVVGLIELNQRKRFLHTNKESFFSGNGSALYIRVN
jgi:hypothetical protein